MLGFDPNAFGTAATQLLLSKGSGLPPLQWQTRANRTSKTQLDAMPTSAMFPGRPIQDAAQANALRAAIYLWHGFLKDCLTLCNSPNCAEHVYWQAICMRHAARPDAAKKLQQRMGVHPVHAALLPVCREQIGLGTDGPVKRFLDTINQVEGFEPYAFTDLYELVRLGKTCEATEKLVRSLQSAEFGFLLKHCHEQAFAAPAVTSP
jgi:hypothetical protein